MSLDTYIEFTVVRAKTLSPADANGLADPFATVYQPRLKICKTAVDKRTHKTPIIKECLNPEWKATFKLTRNVPHDEIREHMEDWTPIVVRVFDWDRFTDPDFMGQAEISLEELFGAPDGLVEKEYELGPCDDHKSKNVGGSVVITARLVGGAGGDAGGDGDAAEADGEASPSPDAE